MIDDRCDVAKLEVLQKLEKAREEYNVLRIVFIDLGIGTSVLTFIPVSPLLDH